MLPLSPFLLVLPTWFITASTREITPKEKSQMAPLPGKDGEKRRVESAVMAEHLCGESQAWQSLLGHQTCFHSCVPFSSPLASHTA